jgi:putative endopeptidase
MKVSISFKASALLIMSLAMGFLFIVAPQQSYAADDDMQSVGPADNFYAWANREWLEKSTIPADQPRVDNFTEIEDVVSVQLRDLLLELKATKVRTPEQEKLVRLYDGFVDMAQRDARGLAPIAGELAKIDALGAHIDVAQYFAYLQAVGVSTPVIIVPEADAKDSSMNIGIIAQAGLGIERDYYLGSDEQSLQQQKLYRDYLTKLFGLAGLSNPDARADQVLALERKLAAIQWSEVQNRDMQKTYNPTTAKAFVAESGEFYGEDLMQVWGAPGDARLSIRQPSYISAYGPLFRGTPVSAWQDYARARLLLTYDVLLTSEFKAANAQYQQDLGLVQEEEALWKQGIGFVGDATNMMLGRAYVEKYYDAQTRAAVTELVLSIRDAYRSAFEQATWMSDETRRKAIAKLDKMQFKIGYPDHWQDYSSLEIPGTDLAENFRRVNLFDHKRNIEKIGRPVNRNDWDNSPHEVNAFYDPTRNEFVLLAAILQPPFYDEKGSAAAKYGGIGFVVGHEIGHGFDDQGSLYDGDGNLVNWWTEADAKAYGLKKQKLIAQANAYEVLPGTFLKGEQEIGEIMGDLSGAQIAMKAYKQTPGASDEAFFSQLAQTWRSKWRDEFLKMVIQRDVHPPSEFRANGIVKQFDAFYDAYDVKQGDKMYLAPGERVLMW